MFVWFTKIFTLYAFYMNRIKRMENFLIKIQKKTNYKISKEVE